MLLESGVGTSTDPFDFAIIEEKLQQGAFTTLPAFSKEVNGMLAMGLATANRIQVCCKHHMSLALKATYI